MRGSDMPVGSNFNLAFPPAQPRHRLGACRELDLAVQLLTGKFREGRRRGGRDERVRRQQPLSTDDRVSMLKRVRRGLRVSEG